MKKIIITISIIFSLLLLTGCTKTDAEKFKEEYESINNKEIYGNKARELNIDKNNNIVYKSDEEIVQMIKNKETFVVYFGFPKCPWCRSVLPSLLDVSSDLGLEKLYYVDVSEIRDTLEINASGEIVTSKKGSDAYYELLELLNSVLEEYTLENKDGEEVNTNEKRIFAPNVVSVVKGEAKELETGIINELTDPYMEITDDMKKEMYNSFKCVIKCTLDASKTCSVNKAC